MVVPHVPSTDMGRGERVKMLTGTQNEVPGNENKTPYLSSSDVKQIKTLICFHSEPVLSS